MTVLPFCLLLCAILVSCLGVLAVEQVSDGVLQQSDEEKQAKHLRGKLDNREGAMTDYDYYFSWDEPNPQNGKGSKGKGGKGKGGKATGGKAKGGKARGDKAKGGEGDGGNDTEGSGNEDNGNEDNYNRDIGNGDKVNGIKGNDNKGNGDKGKGDKREGGKGEVAVQAKVQPENADPSTVDFWNQPAAEDEAVKTELPAE